MRAVQQCGIKGSAALGEGVGQHGRLQPVGVGQIGATIIGAALCGGWVRCGVCGAVRNKGFRSPWPVSAWPPAACGGGVEWGAAGCGGCVRCGACSAVRNKGSAALGWLSMAACSLSRVGVGLGAWVAVVACGAVRCVRVRCGIKGSLGVALAAAWPPVAWGVEVGLAAGVAVCVRCVRCGAVWCGMKWFRSPWLAQHGRLQPVGFGVGLGAGVAAAVGGCCSECCWRML